MILVDTSVWVDHLRSDDPTLAAALDDGQVLMHAFVLGELACGNLKNRSGTLELLGDMPAARIATDAEVLGLIEHRTLMGRGIGYIDCHLLTSTILTKGARIWTRDRNLAAAASDLRLLAFEEEGVS